MGRARESLAEFSSRGKGKEVEKVTRNSNAVDRNGATSFDHGGDYIPLAAPDLSSSSDSDYTPRNRGIDRNGRRNARDPTPPEREWDRGKTKRRERRDQYRTNSRERSLERDADSRDRRRDRSKDRDPGRSRGKRKLEEDLSDAYESKRKWDNPSSRKAPWVTEVKWERCNNVAELMHKEVEAFLRYISPTSAEDEVRGLVIELIAKAVTQEFPDAKVHPFGSFETKLYLPSGDIDLVILSDSMAYSNKVTVLHSLARTLKRAQITSKVSIIANAKVPIIKFVTTHGRFNVDISINQANGLTAGKIVNGFLKNMHGTGQGLALRSLIMITKLFLSQRNMNEVFTGGLGSYSIVCLAISFLQMHPKIRSGEIDAERNLGVLVIEFFELYGCYFNYEDVGISVRDGGTYYNKTERGWSDYRKTHLLSIEDPADPSNDISKGSYGIARVRTTFAGAHGILTAAAYMCAGTMGARREGRTHHLRRGYHHEDLSVLSSVVGVTQETISHRKLIQEVYDQKILHSLLGISPNVTSTSIPDRTRENPSVSETTKEKSPSVSGRKRRQSHLREVELAETGVHSGDEHEDRLTRDRFQGAEEEDEEGRYGIGQERPNKRRKVDRRNNTHAIFTTDDEDATERLSAYGNSGDSLAEEEGEYGVMDYYDGASSKTADVKVERRRSYWLSKGIYP